MLRIKIKIKIIIMIITIIIIIMKAEEIPRVMKGILMIIRMIPVLLLL